MLLTWSRAKVDRVQFRVGWDSLDSATSRFRVEGVVTFLVNRNQHVEVLLAPEWTDQGLVEQFFLGRVLPLILARRGALPLHASSVSHRSNAVAFAGESGAGKSTTAAALVKAGCRIVADDLAVVRSEKGRAVVDPGPNHLKVSERCSRVLAIERRELELIPDFEHPEYRWRGEVESYAVNVLSQVLVLRESNSRESPRITPVDPATKVPLLMSLCFGYKVLLRADARQVQPMLATAVKIARSIRIAYLDRPRTFESLPSIASMVLRDLASTAERNVEGNDC